MTTTPTATLYLSAGYHRHPRLRRIWQVAVVVACVGALLAAPTVVPRPVLAADTSPAPTTSVAVQPCGPAAMPAGHNPPRTVYLAVTGRFVAAGSSRWCTGAPGTGNAGYVWLVLTLDRTWVARSDVCQRHGCVLTIMLVVPTHVVCASCAVRYTAPIARTGTATVVVTTSRVGLGRRDFAEAGGWGGDIKFRDVPDGWWSDSV